MLIGPQHRAVKIVQNTVAVRPQQWHVAGRGDKRLLQCLITCLGKAGGEADSPATSHGGQTGGDLDGGIAVDPQEGGVGCCRKIVKALQAGNTTNLGARRVNRPDVAVES